MRQIIQDIGMEVVRQVFGVQKPRSGKIVLARNAFQKMTEHKLDRETLENAFRHGKRGRGGKITHKYARYSIRALLQAATDVPHEPSAT